MRILRILFLLACCSPLTGCVDRPEVDPKTYGRVVDKLPNLAEVEKPFVFPHGGDNDHRNCVFKDEDFF